MGQDSGGDDSTGIGDTFSREWLKHVQSYVGCTERMRRVSPVLLNCLVHMHLPSRVHCSQSAAPHTASEQFPAQNTSRWLIRQSFSEVQDPFRPMQAPSGQLVHHLQRGADASPSPG